MSLIKLQLKFTKTIDDSVKTTIQINDDADVFNKFEKKDEILKFSTTCDKS